MGVVVGVALCATGHKSHKKQLRSTYKFAACVKEHFIPKMGLEVWVVLGEKTKSYFRHELTDLEATLDVVRLHWYNLN